MLFETIQNPIGANDACTIYNLRIPGYQLVGVGRVIIWVVNPNPLNLNIEKIIKLTMLNVDNIAKPNPFLYTKIVPQEMGLSYRDVKYEWELRLYSDIPQGGNLILIFSEDYNLNLANPPVYITYSGI